MKVQEIDKEKSMIQQKKMMKIQMNRKNIDKKNIYKNVQRKLGSRVRKVEY